MRQSSTPSASTTVKAAALLMAVPALLLPMKAAGQQMASAQPDFSACDRMSSTNPKGAISCRVDVLKAHGAAADERGAAARQESAAVRQETTQALTGGQCLDRLIAGNRDGSLPKAVVMTTEPVVKANGKVSAANACAAEEAAKRILGRAASVQPATLKQ